MIVQAHHHYHKAALEALTQVKQENLSETVFFLI
jgi:hypothetical protein